MDWKSVMDTLLPVGRIWMGSADDEFRIVEKTLIFPRKIKGKWHWLEKFHALQEWAYCWHESSKHVVCWIDFDKEIEDQLTPEEFVRFVNALEIFKKRRWKMN